MRAKVTELAGRRGAMGRGVRACLRALYRRAWYVLESLGSDARALYVECGPAYVLSSATVGTSREKVTRYSVETHAWPALRNALKWEEVPLHVARARGARLRSLHVGGRYGRHLFFTSDALAVAAEVAEDYFDEVAAEARDAAGVNEPWVGNDVEAVVNLRRMPIPGARTVSARCPRGDAHQNGDRKPSLMLWMNKDGVTGGAMCPVCTEHAHGGAPQRFLTWRVLYLADNRAALCTPRKRAHLALTEMCADAGGAARAISSACCSHSSAATTGTADASSTVAADTGVPVGGYVMTNRHEAGGIGRVQHMAYVTATLKAGVEEGDARSRSIGTVARQRDPLQALLWSDRRARGPMAAERAAETAWFARASLEEDSDVEEDEDQLHDDWLPTRVLSISAMRPTGWRDLSAANGRIVSVPAGWEPSAQGWIVFDLDDFDHIEEYIMAKAAGKIVATLRRDQELSGRCAVVQTGPNGLHAWAELREVREDPRAWFASDSTRTWYANLGARVLTATRKAGMKHGKVDMSCCSAGRFARRPGWRVLTNGDLFRSCVVTVAASKVRGRTPRWKAVI